MFVSVPHPPAISCQVISVPSYRGRFSMTRFENVFKNKSNFTVYRVTMFSVLLLNVDNKSKMHGFVSNIF